MSQLRLGPIGDDKPVKLTIEVAPTLIEDIVGYAKVHAEVTGRPVALTPERLIPPIVEHFIASDREFIRRRKGK